MKIWLSEQINIRTKIKDQLVSKTLQMYKELIQFRDEENCNCRRLLCMQPRELYIGIDNTYRQKICKNTLEHAKKLYRENIKFNAIIAEKHECIVTKLAKLRIKQIKDLYRKNINFNVSTTEKHKCVIT
jgi:hypothetical protein